MWTRRAPLMSYVEVGAKNPAGTWSRDQRFFKGHRLYFLQYPGLPSMLCSRSRKRAKKRLIFGSLSSMDLFLTFVFLRNERFQRLQNRLSQPLFAPNFFASASRGVPLHDFATSRRAHCFNHLGPTRFPSFLAAVNWLKTSCSAAANLPRCLRARRSFFLFLLEASLWISSFFRNHFDNWQGLVLNDSAVRAAASALKSGYYFEILSYSAMTRSLKAGDLPWR